MVEIWLTRSQRQVNAPEGTLLGTIQNTIGAQRGESRVSPEREMILACLRLSGVPMTPYDIAARSGLDRSSVRHLLLRLTQSGRVVKMGYGVYAVPDVLNELLILRREEFGALADASVGSLAIAFSGVQSAIEAAIAELKPMAKG